MVSIFDIQVSIKMHGAAIVARVADDREYRYGMFYSMLGLISWVKDNHGSLLFNELKSQSPADESILEIVGRIDNMLNEYDSKFYEEKLAA